MSDVSTISSAISRIAFSRARSSRMPSLTERSGASGCGRRVSLKRRTSAALLASRKMSTGLSRGIFRSLPEDLRKRRQEVALADVDDDRDLLDVAAGAQRQLRQRRNERRRQVVDAEVAEILERANRLRLARPRQAGQDDERLPGSAAPCDRPAGAGLPPPLRRRSSIGSPVLPARAPRLPRPPGPPPQRRPSKLLLEPLGERARRMMAARPQQLIARRDLHEDRDVAARRDRHPDERHAQAEDLVERRRRGRAARTRAPDPSARAARRARRASTTASTRCRTVP